MRRGAKHNFVVGGPMKKFLSLAAAMLLSACATANAPAPTSDAASVPAQNALYIVGENPPQAVSMPQSASGEDLAVVKRVYWYFAGR